MSHFTTIKMKVTDIPALKEACDELKLSFTFGTKARGYNQTIDCDYTISWEGTPYDIAVIKQDDGSYGLQADLWNNHISKKLGIGNSAMGKLLQTYGKYAIMHTYPGYFLNSSTQDEKGNLVLQLENY